jgi:hypothetical protein
MPRKAGSSTTTRKKKADSVTEVPVQAAAENPSQAVAATEAVKAIVAEPAKQSPAKEIFGTEISIPSPKNGKSYAAAATSGGSVSSPSNGGGFSGSTNLNIDDEIRRRAYEIYLQRAKNGQSAGDQNQDWLLAEREVRSRFTGARTTRTL